MVDDLTDLDPEFERMAVWDQLGIILDSYSAGEVVKKEKHTQLTRVITDDDVMFDITPHQAVLIRRMLLLTPVPERRILFRRMQMSEGLKIILKAVTILEGSKHR